MENICTFSVYLLVRVRSADVPSGVIIIFFFFASHKNKQQTVFTFQLAWFHLYIASKKICQTHIFRKDLCTPLTSERLSVWMCRRRFIWLHFTSQGHLSIRETFDNSMITFTNQPQTARSNNAHHLTAAQYFWLSPKYWIYMDASEHKPSTQWQCCRSHTDMPLHHNNCYETAQGVWKGGYLQGNELHRIWRSISATEQCRLKRKIKLLWYNSAEFWN